MHDWIKTLAAARIAPIPEGRRSAEILRHGTMTLRYYAPRDKDEQTPHDQDEIYLVVTGSGTVVSGLSEDSLERRAFVPGDAIFVPAGHVHRFLDFTPDFATWVVFWGKTGGES